MPQMAERIASKVLRYCDREGITVPIGFKRHPSSRYVIIELTDSPKLVARTWFNQKDVVYYLNNLADEVPRRILDFKENEELVFDGGTRLKRVGEFDPA